MLLTLSRVPDALVEGRVKNPSHIVDHETLIFVLDRLTGSPDPYLKYQAAYALQYLMSIPHDEMHRAFVLRHTGNIAMDLLGVTNVCNLGFSGFSDGFGNATASSLEAGAQIMDEARPILESDDEMLAIVKRGAFSGRRQLWYLALREAEEYVQNGRLADFNHFVFETPCYQDVEFRWGVCRLLGEIAVNPLWNVATRQGDIDFLVKLYRDLTIQGPAENVDSWILNILHQVADLPDTIISSHAETLLQGLGQKGYAGEEILCRDVQTDPFNFYLLLTRQPAPTSSPLLAQFREFSDIDYDLHKLRAQRLEERDNLLYIPPQGKLTFNTSGVVLRCIFSANGENLVVSTGNDKIRVYKTTTWTSIAEYQGGGAIVISSVNGELAKRGENNTVELSDILTGEARITLRGHDKTIGCIAYSSNGAYITTASENNSVRIWSTQSGDLVHALESHTQTVRGVAFSPNGRQLASCS